MTELKTLYSEKSHGSFGTFELRIDVGATNLPDFKEEQEIRFAAYDAAKLVKSAIMQAILKNNPEAQQQAKNEKKELLRLFTNPILVEEIPNGYCPDWCCKHLPWFVVTTNIGRFKIGWRKRVIHLEWTETVGTKTAEELFKNEEVTKEGKSIHAWNVEKAQEYINTIINSI